MKFSNLEAPGDVVSAPIFFGVQTLLQLVFGIPTLFFSFFLFFFSLKNFSFG